MVTILAPGSSATGAFWTECAGVLRESPNVVFSVSGAAEAPALVAAIRAAGARQVIAVPTLADVTGENILYEGRPSIVPAPVTMPSAGASSSAAAGRASWPC